MFIPSRVHWKVAGQPGESTVTDRLKGDPSFTVVLAAGCVTMDSALQGWTE
jgi:hypothetical protein